MLNQAPELLPSLVPSRFPWGCHNILWHMLFAHVENVRTAHRTARAFLSRAKGIGQTVCTSALTCLERLQLMLGLAHVRVEVATAAHGPHAVARIDVNRIEALVYLHHHEHAWTQRMVQRWYLPQRTRLHRRPHTRRANQHGRNQGHTRAAPQPPAEPTLRYALTRPTTSTLHHQGQATTQRPATSTTTKKPTSLHPTRLNGWRVFRGVGSTLARGRQNNQFYCLRQGTSKRVLEHSSQSTRLTVSQSDRQAGKQAGKQAAS